MMDEKIDTTGMKPVMQFFYANIEELAKLDSIEDIVRETWEAATAAERERCAKDARALARALDYMMDDRDFASNRHWNYKPLVEPLANSFTVWDVCQETMNEYGAKYLERGEQ